MRKLSWLGKYVVNAYVAGYLVNTFFATWKDVAGTQEDSWGKLKCINEILRETQYLETMKSRCAHLGIERWKYEKIT